MVSSTPAWESESAPSLSTTIALRSAGDAPVCSAASRTASYRAVPPAASRPSMAAAVSARSVVKSDAIEAVEPKPITLTGASSGRTSIRSVAAALAASRDSRMEPDVSTASTTPICWSSRAVNSASTGSSFSVSRRSSGLRSALASSGESATRSCTVGNEVMSTPTTSMAGPASWAPLGGATARSVASPVTRARRSAVARRRAGREACPFTDVPGWRPGPRSRRWTR